MQAPTLNVLCDTLSDSRRALALAVCAHALDLLEQLLGARNDVGVVSQAVGEHILVLEQARVLEQTGDLAEEGDGLLVELLGVANVGSDDSVERQVLALALCERGLELLGSNGKLATDGVLGLLDVRVDVVDVQALRPGRALGEELLGDERGNGQRAHGTGEAHVGGVVDGL